MKYGKLSRKNIETLERLAETPEGKAALTEFVEKQKEARKAYKRYVKLINKKEKSPNEIRAAFIEKCKRYIEKYGVAVNFVEMTGRSGWFANGMFSYGISNIKGVRNEYIEKANALAWLLKDYEFVDETENAPQPNEVVVGMVVKEEYGDVLELSSRRISADGVLNSGKGFNIKGSDLWVGDKQVSKIIDDTNAIYKEGKK